LIAEVEEWFSGLISTMFVVMAITGDTDWLVIVYPSDAILVNAMRP